MSPDPSAGSSLPLVSVIIPATTMPTILARLCRARSDQDYPNYEILVVDDGSRITAEKLQPALMGQSAIFIRKIKVFQQPATPG